MGEIYIKGDTIWAHNAATNSSWYWRKLNSLKEPMHHCFAHNQFTLTASGNYSITKGYLDLVGEHAKMEIAGLVWNSVSLPRHRFVMWLAVHDRLLTKARLQHLHMHVEIVACCLCQQAQVETSRNLFVDCAYAKSVRDEVILWSNITLFAEELKNMPTVTNRKNWKKFKKQVIAALWGAMVYYIWKARNRKQFRCVQIQTIDILGKITSEIVDRIEFL